MGGSQLCGETDAEIAHGGFNKERTAQSIISFFFSFSSLFSLNTLFLTQRKLISLYLSRILSIEHCASPMDATALTRSFSGAVVGAKSPFSKKLHLPAQFSRAAIGKKQPILSCLKATETSSVLSSDAVSTVERTKAVKKGTFPSGVEGMLRDICDGTSVAEVKLKVGKFQMYLKRDVESSPVESHPPSYQVAVAPPVPSASVNDSAVTSHQETEAAPKSSSEENNPFKHVSGKDARIALQGLDASSYEIVSAPTVGVFLRSRTVKGEKRPSVCKEGMVIKEGQVIGFITQFENDLPIRSNVAGEIISFLCKDGEPVGYGDPLLAVLPSFHGSEIGL
ncbi:Biotin/lipoyl attachment domain protein [Rhynchospora pubera]|uniref:Biotin/lipoyl attachment domain protein n=1 Tax=Rhynchospora pubera TaxID=906938 RepID=A0AAV8FRR4_9POAL|nr:Biotin/lipoyl attachment domain protein [Rhynchospora pubera]